MKCEKCGEELQEDVCVVGLFGNQNAKYYCRNDGIFWKRDMKEEQDFKDLIKIKKEMVI